MTVLVYGRGCAWGMIRGGYTALMGGSRWGAVRPSRLSEAFERRTWASQIFYTSLGPYLCAPQVAGTSSPMCVSDVGESRGPQKSYVV